MSLQKKTQKYLCLPVILKKCWALTYKGKYSKYVAIKESGSKHLGTKCYPGIGSYFKKNFFFFIEVYSWNLILQSDIVRNLSFLCGLAQTQTCPTLGKDGVPLPLWLIFAKSCWFVVVKLTKDFRKKTIQALEPNILVLALPVSLPKFRYL